MDQTLDDVRAHSEAPAAVAPYGPGVKADFDRLYRATYQRNFAPLMLILRNPAAALVSRTQVPSGPKIGRKAQLPGCCEGSRSTPSP
jgi:hypothetical protein